MYIADAVVINRPQTKYISHTKKFGMHSTKIIFTFFLALD